MSRQGADGFIYDNVLATIGNTPLVRLNRINRRRWFSLLGKFEGYNPAGSNKDRAALNIIRHGIESGEITPETVVVESSSGNMGIGLAQACRYYGLRFICVVDTRTTRQNLDVLRAYGVEVEIVRDPDPVTGDLLPARIERTRELLAAYPASFSPNQYSNMLNALAHYRTMKEIAEALDGKIDILCCPTSTCGTIRGCAEYARDHRLHTRIIAVDAVGSAIFGGAKGGARRIPGHGSAIRPGLFDPLLLSDYVQVSDLDCVVGCRRLMREEAIMAGGSSGGVIMAIDRIAETFPEGTTCVGIFPDRGERYLDTIYSDEWVMEEFGDIRHYWTNTQGSDACTREIS